MAVDAADLDWLNHMVCRVAAAEIMPRFRNLDVGDVSEKGSATDLVTVADISAEREITASLTKRYPGSLVVGEEGCAAEPSLLEGLAAAKLAFVVDPVDGTFNFARGVPLFGTMLAVVENGETVAGIIHDPVGGDSLVAVRGGGAFIRTPAKPDQRISVAAAVETTDMVGSISWYFMPEPMRSTVARNVALFKTGMGFRCAAHEYRLVATGGIHFTLYNKLMPWDHLPGALIHAEAGGYSARFDGSAYNCSTLSGGIIAAPDRDSWQCVRNALFKGKV